MDPAIRLVFRAAGMDKDDGRFDRETFQRFISHQPTTGGITYYLASTTHSSVHTAFLTSNDNER
jgi:hypothetical protein